MAVDFAREAGDGLLETFGVFHEAARKADQSNVVTAADLRSERCIVEGIRRAFPSHSVIAEETGCARGPGDYTWVVDPLDGTSNYAAGIPWFGVLIAVLRRNELVAAVMHLPATHDTYVAEAGSGAFRNGRPIRVSDAHELANVLWACGMDAGTSDEEAQRNGALIARLARSVRNIRTTNSLVDAAYTSDGRLGGLLNLQMRLWDLAAPKLIVGEAGGVYTDACGAPLVLDLSRTACDREYAVLAGAPPLHEALVREMRLA